MSRASRQVVTPDGFGVATWSATVEAATVLNLEDLVPPRSGRLVVVAAHPDDETIGAGRLVASWCRQVGPVRAITLTAGEACLDHLGIALAGLGTRRVAEWARAMRTLGAQADPCWGVPDGGVQAVVGDVAERLSRLLHPDDVVLAPWRHDPHPDHAAAGAAAHDAAAGCGATLVEYPVWMTYWCEPTVLDRTAYRLLRVTTDRAAERIRAAALAHFVSQQQPLRADLTPVVPARMLAHHHCQLVLRPAEPSDA